MRLVQWRNEKSYRVKSTFEPATDSIRSLLQIYCSPYTFDVTHSQYSQNIIYVYIYLYIFQRGKKRELFLTLNNKRRDSVKCYLLQYFYAAHHWMKTIIINSDRNSENTWEYWKELLFYCFWWENSVDTQRKQILFDSTFLSLLFSVHSLNIRALFSSFAKRYQHDYSVSLSLFLSLAHTMTEN